MVEEITQEEDENTFTNNKGTTIAPDPASGLFVFHLVTGLHQAVSRLYYTVSHSPGIDLDNPEIDTNGLIDNLKEATVRADLAIKDINRAERLND